MLKEFKDFIMRGNVLDMAIGVVMGAAFTAIVNALVDAVIMPLVNAISGTASVEELFTVQVGAATLQFGVFLQAVIDFLIIAFVLFLIIKGINSVSNRFKRAEEEVQAPTAEAYLEEIRDILASQNAQANNTKVADVNPDFTDAT